MNKKEIVTLLTELVERWETLSDEDGCPLDRSIGYDLCSTNLSNTISKIKGEESLFDEVRKVLDKSHWSYVYNEDKFGVESIYFEVHDTPEEYEIGDICDKYILYPHQIELLDLLLEFIDNPRGNGWENFKKVYKQNLIDGI